MPRHGRPARASAADRPARSRLSLPDWTPCSPVNASTKRSFAQQPRAAEPVPWAAIAAPVSQTASIAGTVTRRSQCEMRATVAVSPRLGGRHSEGLGEQAADEEEHGSHVHRLHPKIGHHCRSLSRAAMAACFRRNSPMLRKPPNGTMAATLKRATSRRDQPPPETGGDHAPVHKRRMPRHAPAP